MKNAFMLVSGVALSCFLAGGISWADDATAPADAVAKPPPVTVAPVMVEAHGMQPAKSPAKGDDDAQAKANREAEREAEAELAQAQSMADAALTNGGSAQATSGEVSTDSDAPVRTSVRSESVHHTMTELSSRPLGPDGSDTKHHSMGELF
jgi:hypothetical protein